MANLLTVDDVPRLRGCGACHIDRPTRAQHSENPAFPLQKHPGTGGGDEL